MHWNHRLVCNAKEPQVVIVAEVFYSDGNPAGYGEASALFDAEVDNGTPAESIASQLEHMMEATRHPILYYPADFTGSFHGVE
jgi:hypothetical protein